MSEDQNKPLPKETSTSPVDVEQSALNTVAAPISTNISLPPHTVSFYVLRIADINDAWVFQAILENDIKFNFEPICSLAALKVNSPDVVTTVKRNVCLEKTIQE